MVVTGERMETVREALRVGLHAGRVPAKPPGLSLHEHAAALAEVERWEHDRARLTAARDDFRKMADVVEREWQAAFRGKTEAEARLEAFEKVANGVVWLANNRSNHASPFFLELFDALTEDAWAALGEGQDSDLAAAGSASGNDGTAGIATPDGTTERVSRPGVPAAARSCCGDPGDCGHHPECAEVPPCRA
jgi:hypothetical protein